MTALATAPVRPITSADISRQHDAKPLGRFGAAVVRRPVSEAVKLAEQRGEGR